MVIMRKCGKLVAASALAALLLLLSPGLGFAQTPARGTITGTVTADQGQVRGFRVTAHNLRHMIWYVVFTKDGKYTLPQALPGPYEISVLQDGYDSPVEKSDLVAGQSQMVNMALKKQAAKPSDAVYKTFEEMYPPGPGLDLLKKNCIGCHGPDSYNTMHFTEAGFRTGLRKMMDGPFNLGGVVPPMAHTPITKKEQDTMVQYLTTNFGPDSPNQRLKHDAYPVDEDALSKAIYVEYDLTNLPPAPSIQKAGKPADSAAETITSEARETRLAADRLKNPDPKPYLHDPFIAKDNTIWYADPPTNAMVHLDPRSLDPGERWKFYPLPTDAPGYVFLHGITLDSKGHVYWAEIFGGMVGELDPATGKMTRHALPTAGSLLQVVTDQKDNIWYDDVHGDGVGKLDAQTRLVSQFPTLTPDLGLYGMAVDPKGNVWSAGYAKSIVVKFDPVTESYTEYATPTPGGSARRIGVDSKGIVWFSEWAGGQLGRIDPETGKIAEYKFPIRSRPYETWPDKLDNIWVSDDFNNSLVYFEPQTKKFTYFPLPQVWPVAGVPKVEIEANNTVWLGSRFTEHVVAIHFYPHGYSADAPPLP
jgi:virginiamycin B lyase